MRIREPKCTALVFKSGKIVLAGTKSESDLAAAAKKFVDLLSVNFYLYLLFLAFIIKFCEDR